LVHAEVTSFFCDGCGSEGVASKENNIGLCLLELRSGVWGLSRIPLYVYKSMFSQKLRLYDQDDEILRVLSFILWTFTFVFLYKYIFFV